MKVGPFYMHVGLLIVSCLQSPNEVHTFKRESPLTDGRGVDVFFGGSRHIGPPKRMNCVTLLTTNQVVRALQASQVPLAHIYPKGNHTII